MNNRHFSLPTLESARRDVPAGIVVFLVALPLCLGIALASGAPLFAGVISGVVAGLVVGLRSDRRRREIALLRLRGASIPQVARLVGVAQQAHFRLVRAAGVQCDRHHTRASPAVAAVIASRGGIIGRQIDLAWHDRVFCRRRRCQPAPRPPDADGKAHHQDQDG